MDKERWKQKIINRQTSQVSFTGKTHPWIIEFGGETLSEEEQHTCMLSSYLPTRRLLINHKGKPVTLQWGNRADTTLTNWSEWACPGRGHIHIRYPEDKYKLRGLISPWWKQEISPLPLFFSAANLAVVSTFSSLWNIYKILLKIRYAFVTFMTQECLSQGPRMSTSREITPLFPSFCGRMGA